MAKNSCEIVAVLNRLLQLLCHSLPRYLQDAKPYASPDQAALCGAIDALAADQAHYARRTAEAILDSGGEPEPGAFSTGLACVNDLGVDYLLQEVLRRHRDDTAEIEAIDAVLAHSAAHAPLAREILGNARGHLDILQRLVQD